MVSKEEAVSKDFNVMRGTLLPFSPQEGQLVLAVSTLLDGAQQSIYNALLNRIFRHNRVKPIL